MLINLTPNAVQEAKRILTKDGNALRVGIEGGGCSGFSYKLLAVDLEDNYNEKEVGPRLRRNNSGLYFHGPNERLLI